MKYDVVVIGGGPAGLMAALFAAKGNKSVCLIEKNPETGKKLLLTGNGKCNITNEFMDVSCYHSSSDVSFFDVIKQFDNNALISFFHKAGMLTMKKNGGIYPYSNYSRTVLAVLLKEIAKNNIDLYTSTTVNAVSKNENFEILTNKATFHSEKLIIAAGGRAYPKTGSDGSGYNLLKAFGHTVTETVPSLTGIKCSDDFFAELFGVRTEAEITCRCEGKTAKDRGELQFNENGISGIVTFQVSGFVQQMLKQNKKVSVSVDLFPGKDVNELSGFISDIMKNNPNLSLENMLSGIFQKKLAHIIIVRLGKKCKSKCSENEGLAEDIAKQIKSFSCNPVYHDNYDLAQCTRGGINLDEINPETMESVKCKGLYLAGEILDVDGICGGYNLQWAFSSGFVAGKNAGEAQ